MDGTLTLTAARDFGIALLIGVLIGIEREKRKAREPQPGIGGIRTFILIAEAGAVSAWVSRHVDAPWPFLVTLLGVAALLVTSYLVEARVTAGQSAGLTTEMAALTTCLLGGLCLFGFPELAVALAIVTATVLAFKEPIHGLVERIGSEDLYAGLKLLVASFIVLPLLPNRPVDPWGALNPYQLWWLVILISGLSLVGYVAMRWVGPERGTALTGFFGGLASSTAVTLTFARRSREERGVIDALATGLLLSWGVMFVRVLVEVAVVHPPLLGALVVPFAAMGVVTVGQALVLYLRAGTEAAGAKDVPLRNPFSLVFAIRFALFFAGVMLLVALVQRYFPGRGEVVVAAIAGLTDVDAITLSMAAYARGGGDADTAVQAITVAAFTNTIVKAGLIVALGAAALKWRMVVATAVIIACGAAALLLI
jgi:uncharacterized membrane protein (DUF4010 family)